NGQLRDGTVVTNTGGLYTDVVAEYILWAMITISRRLNLVMKAQTQAAWAQYTGEGLRGKMLGVLGLGRIGRMAAARARAFDMKVVGVRRGFSQGFGSQDAERLYPLDGIQEFLRELDFLLVSVPVTQETKGLIGWKELSAMKKGAFLIDITGGGVIRHDDLIRAAREGVIGGAVLDSFEQEPLQSENMLWGLPNVVITPHISGLTVDYAQKVGGFFCDNLKRFIKGEELTNRIDRTKGY
ncbi:MAG: D-2-hydroxyacid dehydrogenase, partial [Nitrospirae bacterium]|nr:D-2-hydroxyacid dehydrogenase [Nitrospirota bacterium]